MSGSDIPLGKRKLSNTSFEDTREHETEGLAQPNAEEDQDA